MQPTPHHHPNTETFELGNTPTTKEAQAVADVLFAEFVSENVDKVELIFTKFVSLIASSPVIQTLLPLTPKGEICDVDGNCVDAAEDEIFKLTTVDGKLAVETEKVCSGCCFIIRVCSFAMMLIIDGCVRLLVCLAMRCQ